MAQLNLVGKRYRFESLDKRGSYIGHIDFEMHRRDDDSASTLRQQDTTFDIVPGLAGVGISFRSVNYPNKYVRLYSDYYLYLHAYGDQPETDITTYRKDASWIPELGLADSTNGVSFRSVNYPSRYLRYTYLRNKPSLRALYWAATPSVWLYFTWIPVLVAESKVNGEWKQIYGNSNAVTSGEYTATTTEGINIEDSSSTSTTEVKAWRSAKTVSAQGFEFEGLKVGYKVVFEQSESTSVTQSSSHLYGQETRTITGYKFNLVKGTPFFLWQWEMTAIASDGTSFTLKTNHYKQTTTTTAPEKFDGKWADI